ncbi:DUF4372 domain-containing protein [Candidatus Nitrotoga sp. HW29]|uniref:DUF4372 domain-containing protein n=1 Tax=Candidatus Nitrotoga sp. HW29 TaxID=2886963 RepID=UPI00403D9CC9
MNTGKLVFAQVMSYLPLTTFRRCVARYNGEHKVKHFTLFPKPGRSTPWIAAIST